MLDILSNILEHGTVILLFGWLIVSPFVLIWFLNTEKSEQLKEHHEKFKLVVYIGTILSLFIVLLLGIERSLVFIPSNRVIHYEGEPTSLKYFISFCFAVFFSFLFICLLHMFENLRSENRRLKIVEEIKKLYVARHYSRESLLQKLEETEDQLQNLQQRFNNGLKLSADEKNKMIKQELFLIESMHLIDQKLNDISHYQWRNILLEKRDQTYDQLQSLRQRSFGGIILSDDHKKEKLALGELLEEIENQIREIESVTCSSER